MSYPELPTQVKHMLASEGMRVHHHLWHFVRSEERWRGLPAQSRQQLTDAGWVAPRFEAEPGAGLDFLGMHRQMIKMVDQAFAAANNPAWQRVEGWVPIPWADDDADWPVPDWPDMPEPAVWARQPDTVTEMRSLVDERYRNDDYLARVSLDQLGTAVEWSIHGWMHIRWSGRRPDNAETADPSNDWLYVPWSSHVNKHFWKLHGWIDERIGDWERANNESVDLSNAWSGPAGTMPSMPHSAEIALMSAIPSREEMPIPMGVRRDIVEGVRSGQTPPWGLKPGEGFE